MKLLSASMMIAATAAVLSAAPLVAQYTADTALSDSVLAETRKIDGKPRGETRMTAKQRAFWKKYCAKWPEGGSCDRYRREIARYPESGE